MAGCQDRAGHPSEVCAGGQRERVQGAGGQTEAQELEALSILREEVQGPARPGALGSTPASAAAAGCRACCPGRGNGTVAELAVPNRGNGRLCLLPCSGTSSYRSASLCLRQPVSGLLIASAKFSCFSREALCCSCFLLLLKGTEEEGGRKTVVEMKCL